MMKKYTRAGGH